MPKEIDGQVYYTKTEVEAGFLPRETVRTDFMPRAEFERRGQRLESQVLELTAKVEATKGLQTENEKLKADITRTLDQSAFRSAGLLDEQGNVDTSRADFLRMAHRHHIGSLPEDKRPADAAEHFRSWLTSDDGARGSDFTKHLFPAASAAPAAPGADAPAGGTATTPAAPTDIASVVAAAVQQALGQQGAEPPPKSPGLPKTGAGAARPAAPTTLTAADIGREAKSIASAASTPEARTAARERLQQLRQQLQTGR